MGCVYVQIARAAVVMAAVGSSLLLGRVSVHVMAKQLAQSITSAFQAVLALAHRPAQQVSSASDVSMESSLGLT